MLTQWIRAVVAVALAGWLAGCGGGAGDEPPANPGVATIGVAGGTVLAVDGAQVVFPKDALRTDITVRIAKDSTGAPPLPPAAVAAGAVYSITPHGGVFDSHVEVSIPVEPAMIGSGEQLLLITAEPGDTQWRVLSGAKFADGKLRAPVVHFSFFRVIVMPDFVVPSLVTMISGMNNTGDDGALAISPDFDITGEFFKPTGERYGLRVPNFQAFMHFPATRTAGRASGTIAPPTPTICTPVSYGHDGAQWRFFRDRTLAPNLDISHLGMGPVDTNSYPRTWDAYWNSVTPGASYGYFSGFGAMHVYGQDNPSRGDYMQPTAPNRSLDVWALPPAGNLTSDDLLTWSGQGWFYAQQHNGRMRMEVSVLTTCGLLVEAVPLSFRLNIVDSGVGYMGLHWLPDVTPGVVSAILGADAEMFVGEQAANTRPSSVLWEYSNDAVNWQGLQPPGGAVASGPIMVEVNAYSWWREPLRLYALRVPNVNAASAGYYRTLSCATVDANVCLRGDVIRLVVISEMPSIARHPGGQAVLVGETASFSVTTGGLPAPTLQWQKLAEAKVDPAQVWTDIEGATGTSFTTAPATLADNGAQVRVRAVNAVGSVVSDKAMLTVIEALAPPVIQAQPGNLNTTVGGTAVFAATVSGTAPLSYQWLRNGSNLTGANSAILTLANVSAANDGRYELVVSNPAGSVTSEPAVLVVTLGTPVALPPTIAAPPASITVAAGNAANFAVAVTGTGPYTYLWMKDGVWTTLTNGDRPSLSIASITAADAGAYTVRVTNSVGTVVSAAATLTVTAGTGGTPVAPAITTAPAALAVLPGAGATFAVAVTGTGPFTYQWRHNGADIAGATDAVLHFAAVAALDAGQYAVAVRNTAGVANSAAVPLIVIGAPGITQQPTSATAYSGATASFSVIASGDGVQYQWLKNSVAIGGAAGASYTTPALGDADNGAVYGVIVYNGAGLVFSQGAVLTVTPAVAPSFSTQPSSQSVVAPATATFTVAASGTPAPTLQWQSSGDGGGTWANIAGATSASYTTPATSVADSGRQYRAVATNIAGPVASTAATLTVTGAVVAKAWQAAALVETDNVGDARDAQVAFDASGNALAVWTQNGNARSNIWANRYTAGTGWGTAVLIETDDTGSAYEPQIAVDGNGDAFAVWTQAGSLGTTVQVNRYTAATNTWGTAVAIGSGGLPKIAFDNAGHAMAVWNLYSGGTVNVWANRYVAGTGWAGAAAIFDVGNSGGAPDIAFDAGGNALLVALHWNGVRTNVYAKRYRVATNTWDAPVLIESDDSGTTQAPEVAIDANGNGVAVWMYFDGTGYKVMANRYAASTNTWGATTLGLSNAAASGYRPKVAFDTSGNAVAVWMETVGARYSIWSSRYTAGVGWGTAEQLSDAAAPDAVSGADMSPQVAIDGSGNAFAVWNQEDGTRTNIWANRYTAGTGWGSAALLETDNASNALRAQVAFDANGNAMVVWGQRETGASVINLWARSYR